MANRILLIPDASVLINVLASGSPKELLLSSGADFSVPRQVIREVRKNPVDGGHSPNILLPLIEGGFLREVELAGDCLELFLELVTAPAPDNLDDGEAASLASAATWGATVVLDDAKGRRICREKFPELHTLWSIELFQACVKTAGTVKVRDWLENAILRARMRVPQAYKGWVDAMLKDALRRNTA